MADEATEDTFIGEMMELEDYTEGPNPSSSSFKVPSHTLKQAIAYNLGDLVWVQITTKPWWPAMIITQQYSCKPASPGHHWVITFGEHHILEVPTSMIVDFANNYPEKSSNLRDTDFQSSVLEALRVCANRAGHQANISQEMTREELLEWGGTGFQNSHQQKCSVAPRDGICPIPVVLHKVLDQYRWSKLKILYKESEEKKIDKEISAETDSFGSGLCERLLEWRSHDSQMSDQSSVDLTGRSAVDLTVNDTVQPFEQPTCKPILNKEHGRSIQQEHICEFVVGSLVWAKMSGFPWWPAVIINGQEACMKPAKDQHVWVFWFGDHKISQVPLRTIESFAENYNQRISSKGGKMYRRAIMEIFKECASRAGLLADDSPDDSMDDLFKWAEGGFRNNTGEICKFTARDGKLPAMIDLALASIRGRIPETKGEKTPNYELKKDRQELKDVWSGTKSIQDVCIACPTDGHEVVTEHPLFYGGLCKICMEDMWDSMFVYDREGWNMYCSVCSCGGKLYLCEQPNCSRGYCNACLLSLVGENSFAAIEGANPWVCFLCSDPEDQLPDVLIRAKPSWRENIAQFYKPNDMEIPSFANSENKRPIRVLSLFDGLASGLLALNELGIDVEVYSACEINDKAILITNYHHHMIKQLGDVSSLTDDMVAALCPIDLLIGGSPCNELSVVNVIRKEFGSASGRLFFEYHRILNAIQTKNEGTHLFWMFENVSTVSREVKRIISEQFGCQPAMWDASIFSAQRRRRFFWGNLPGLYGATDLAEDCNDDMENKLNSLLLGNRHAKVTHVGTVTTNTNSLVQGKKNKKVPPIMMGDKLDTMWIQELEMLFGFPCHYTDIGNLSSRERLKLIGAAWSVQTVKHLLAPLKSYFATNVVQSLKNAEELEAVCQHDSYENSKGGRHY